MGTDVVFFKLTTHVLMKNDRISPFACGFSFINLQSLNLPPFYLVLGKAT